MKSMYERIILQEGKYRILEVECDYVMEDLKGDCFDKNVNSDIDPDILEAQEKAFENQVYSDGVFGYILEVWNAEIDKGWEHVDSCFGFVGQYGRPHLHYIVDELKAQIEGGSK